MNVLATPIGAPALGDSSPRLCETIEGVEFSICLAAGKRIRCIVSDAALQTHFGAEAMPESWLDAFARHRVDIEGCALVASARRGAACVVFLNDSAGRLKVVAGGCRD